MTRSVGLAYAVTGAAVASAVIAITATTAGFVGPPATPAPAAFETAGVPAADGQPGVAPADSGVSAVSEAPLFRYVNEPSPGRRSHEAHERFEHRERRDDDD